ncbi:hypothetical protein GCM10010329_83110 [Streptomyces spiroverticillatus]|uniref:LysM domain-containing protein n=1 Tax=Streptomyces finlayi TaxID=67296 RepID=A0A919CG06_9ACTN|nr:LysM peptidoglycan-binding domain-containing protein [Streptomyces finlayi]GHA48060.1 hypothetical protein GCM10010329_83110 [Streptomyces spiroverticillatus]GHD18902.1 hypothetical protein GCM10010334_82170 [Streptomyces finlayi]
MTTSGADRQRGAAAVVRALLSLIAVLALVGGLPVLLWHATAATWAPGLDALGQLLSSADTVPVFLLALTVLGWAGWAAFTLSLAVEIPAQVRGLSAPRLPGLGTGQRAAALLVGGILLLLPTGTALASPAQATTTISAPKTTGAPAAEGVPASAAEARSTATKQEAPTYTVRDLRPAESLWSIAEDHLGDGSRYTEIADLNEGRTMNDGNVFRTQAPIQPGWVLRMPATPTTSEVPTTPPQGDAAQSSTTSYTVKAGDTLTAIAEDQLGDAEKYPEIYTANKKTLADPDHIYPGQHLTLPADPGAGPAGTAPAPTPHRPAPAPAPGGDKSSGAPDPKTPAPEPVPTSPAPSATPSPSAPASPAPSDRAPEAPVPPANTPPQAPSSPASAPTSASPAPEEEGGAVAESASSMDLRTVAGTGALLAGSVVSALALRRLLQRRRRKPGQSIPVAQTGRAEQLLGAAAEQASPQLLDHALRALAQRAAADNQQVPVLRAATVTARTVGVLPDDLSAEPVWPFVAGPDGAGSWWQLPAAPALPEAAVQVPPPLPGLVSVGARADNSLLLLNLPAVRSLLLDGTAEQVEQVALSLALELSQSPWAATTEIVAVGFGKDLAQLLPTARIQYVAELAHATRDLAERAIEAHLDEDEKDGEGSAPVGPWILLAPGPVTDEDAWALADALDKTRDVPTCVVLPAAVRARFPDADVLDAGVPQTELQPLPCVDERVRLQRLEPEIYQEVLHALQVAGQPPQDPDPRGPWTHVPQEPVPLTPQAAARQAAQNRPARAHTPGPGNRDRDRDRDTAEDSGIFHSLLAAVQDPASVTAVPAPVPPADPPPAAAAAPLAPEVKGPGRPGAGAAPTPPSSPPLLRMLGPIEVTRLSGKGHGPKLALLTALLHFRPSRDGYSIREAMDPKSPWSADTFSSRMTTLRAQLGTAEDGQPYVVRRRAGAPYTLHPDFTCDWHAFLRLAEHGLASKTVEPLDEALSLVRGRPFGTHAPTWAFALQQEMITRITDIAHAAAQHHTAHGLYDKAGHALNIGLEVDDSAELLHRDLLRLEAARGNRAGIQAVVELIRRVNDHLDVSMEPETEHLITELLSDKNTEH